MDKCLKDTGTPQASPVTLLGNQDSVLYVFCKPERSVPKDLLCRDSKLLSSKSCQEHHTPKSIREVETADA